MRNNGGRSRPGSFYGTVDDGPCQDVIFMHHPWKNKVYEYGPYSTRAEFNKGMIKALERSRPGEKLQDGDKSLAEKLLATGSDQEDIEVVTHGDLNVSNIIAQDGVITGIVFHK